MKPLHILYITSLILLLVACQSDQQQADLNRQMSTKISTPKKDTIPRINLKTTLSRSKFDSLHGAELQLALMKPIFNYKYDNEATDSLLFTLLNDDQKAFYQFRIFDDEFIETGMKEYLAFHGIDKINLLIKHFNKLELNPLVEILEKLDAKMKQKVKNGISAERLQRVNPIANQFDDMYFDVQDDLYILLEEYIRTHEASFLQIQENIH